MNDEKFLFRVYYMDKNSNLLSPFKKNNPVGRVGDTLEQDEDENEADNKVDYNYSFVDNKGIMHPSYTKHYGFSTISKADPELSFIPSTSNYLDVINAQIKSNIPESYKGSRELAALYKNKENNDYEFLANSKYIPGTRSYFLSNMLTHDNKFDMDSAIPKFDLDKNQRILYNYVVASNLPKAQRLSALNMLLNNQYTSGDEYSYGKKPSYQLNKDNDYFDSNHMWDMLVEALSCYGGLDDEYADKKSRKNYKKTPGTKVLIVKAPLSKLVTVDDVINNRAAAQRDFPQEIVASSIKQDSVFEDLFDAVDNYNKLTRESHWPGRDAFVKSFHIEPEKLSDAACKNIYKDMCSVADDYVRQNNIANSCRELGQ